MKTRHILVLAPLLLAAAPASPSLANEAGASTVMGPLDAETHTVTLKITGMT